MKYLKLLVSELAGCNQMGVKPQQDWYTICKGIDLIDLDKQAKVVLDSGYYSVLTFIDGEESEAESLVKTLEVYELDDFLNKVFNDDIKLLV